MDLDDAAIDRIAHRLIDRSLPKAEWTHAAHFAAALWLARHRPGTAMAPLIRAYNIATGGVNDDSQGYHETITVVSRAAAAAALDGAPDAALATVLADVLAGPCGQSGWLLAHWRRETLFAPLARQNWVAPDLAPLPFPVDPARN